MTSEFFASKSVIDLLNGYSALLKGINVSDKFEEDRNGIIVRIFQLFIANPKLWDEKAAYNIRLLKEPFLRDLEKKSMTREEINSIFTTCFRFCVEPSIFSDSMENRSHVLRLLKDFGIYRLDEFDPVNKEQLQYALREMPIDMVKDFLKSYEAESFKDFKDKLKAGIEFASTWEEYIENQKEKIEGIKNNLKGYESAFNFVGLYDGFNSLSKQKKRDIGWSKFVLFLLAIAIPAPLLLEYFYIKQSTVPTDIANKIISIIPFLSFTLILIYYFRVVLLNYTSLRTQIMQIELRKSLCQFIQSYSDYSSKIKTNNPDALSKFEDIIFSNIMSSDEKIPSTFDGIEQVASILSSLKSK
ncbi:hypothetical protein PYX08_02000 [Citrobacter freundii]|nr:hypothetical protein [Citrobacter freundii]MDE5190188.1 hypothetical protein [Citrobacter freundii]